MFVFFISIVKRLSLQLELSLKPILTFYKKSSSGLAVLYTTSVFTLILQPAVFYDEPVDAPILLKLVSKEEIE